MSALGRELRCRQLQLNHPTIQNYVIQPQTNQKAWTGPKRIHHQPPQYALASRNCPQPAVCQDHIDR